MNGFQSIAALVLLIPIAVSAAEPVNITSESLTINSETGGIDYQGNVVAKQGSFTMRSQWVKAQYDRATQQIETMRAGGGVTFQDKDRSGKAKTAFYAVPTSHLTLKGAPEIIDGVNRISGTQIEYFMLDGTLKVQNARTRFSRDALQKDQSSSKAKEAK